MLKPRYWIALEHHCYLPQLELAGVDVVLDHAADDGPRLAIPLARQALGRHLLKNANQRAAAVSMYGGFLPCRHSACRDAPAFQGLDADRSGNDRWRESRGVLGDRTRSGAGGVNTRMDRFMVMRLLTEAGVRGTPRMSTRRILLCGMLAGLACIPLTRELARAYAPPPSNAAMQKRWLFIWRNMSSPVEVDRMIARFPRAQADGYNGVAFAANIPAEKAPALREAARKYGLDLVAIVMGGIHDRNYNEGVLSRDALFLAHGGAATHQPENPAVVNGDFEDATGNRLKGWPLQDDDGTVSFVDREVTHSGKASLRMENIGKNPNQHCRVSQPIKLIPHRQYRISFWVKSQDLSPADAEVKVLTADAGQAISFQTFHTARTQDWKHYDLVFNSLNTADARLYVGSWSGKSGKLWWDDVRVEEIGLVNVLRRPGCPVTVRGENGTAYEVGRDYQQIVDPQLQPYQAYHQPPVIRLAAGTRIKDGERLRVSYYHPVIVYEDRLTTCLSEPRIFDEWRDQVRRANELLHPAAFFMSHDEMRVMNQCALCQSKGMTPGQLLAWNVRKATQIIREVRPDAGIWVWNDMFDPMHNARDHYFAVNGSLKGSWEGLDKEVGIVNWNGGLKGKNCCFFADRGLKQILAGYYDGDENGAAISEWRANTRDVPGIVGAIYTTWEDRYDAMDRWAEKAWGGGAAR